MIFDAHCDTLTNLLDKQDDLYQNTGHFDIKRAEKAGIGVQVFAAWIEGECKQPFQRAEQKIAAFFTASEKYYQYIHHVRCFSDIEQAVHGGKLAAILSIEGGEALEGEIDKLMHFFRLGVRMLGLTWNGANAIADGVGVECPKGLTPFGEEVVAKANQSGIVIDLSHIAEAGFWDVLAATQKPVAISHSNAYKQCPHVRNLTDEQFLALKKNGGVVGLNFYTPFLTSGRTSTVGDVFRHLEHFLALGGENHVGFGADFDGMDKLPKGIMGVEGYPDIVNEMVRRNYSTQLIEKITLGNFMRLMYENMTALCN